VIITVLGVVLLGIFAAWGLGPPIYRKLVGRGGGNTWDKLEAHIKAYGTSEHLKRLNKLKQRRLDFQLRSLEVDQAKAVIGSPDIRKAFEKADGDIEEMLQLLSPYEDELEEKFKLLEESLNKQQQRSEK
jgi:hypothetical protein